MGNSKSEILKEEFRQKKFKTIKKGSDRLMGPFEILVFKEYPQNFFLKKKIDPSDYEQQAQIDQFVANLSQQNKYIAEFYFVQQTSSKKDIFDLIFEYGNQMQNKLQKEKYIWDLIEQIVEGMIVLEQQNLHYPFIHGRFILQESNNKFKLVNPYCFENYLKDVLHIYLNPMETMNRRRSYCQQQILKNIRELGCLILVMLGNFDEIQIYENPQYRRQCIQQLRNNKIKFYEFLDFIFDADIYAVSFSELKEWLNKNVQKQSSGLFKIFQEINPSKTQPQQQKFQQTFPQKNKLKIFSNEPIQIRNTQDIGKEMLQMAFQEEKEKLINEQHSKKTSTEESLDKSLQKSQSQEKLNKNDQQQDQRFQSLGQSNLSHDMQNSAEEDNLLDDLDQMDFFNDDNISNQLKKRNSINETPIINSQTDLDHQHLENFNFLNQDQHSAKNITSYLKNNSVQKQIEQSNQQDEQNNIDKDLKDDIKRQEKVAKFISKNYENDSNILIEENKPLKIIQSDVEQKSENKSPQKNTQSFLKQTQPENNIVEDKNKNNFQPPSLQEKPKKPKNTSQIQKIAIRWNKEEQKYFKEVLYKDGSQEVLEMDEKESIRYSQMGQQRTNSVAQKNAQKQTQQKQIQKGKVETFSILLYQQIDQQPLLIVKSDLDSKKGNFINDLDQIVDRSNSIKASVYHKVFQEGIDVQKLAINCKRMKASMHITKEQYFRNKQLL